MQPETATARTDDQSMGSPRVIGLRGHVEMIAKIRAESTPRTARWAYPSPEHAVLALGKESSAVPAPPPGQDRGEIKMCFNNAHRAAVTDGDLLYVEGYAYWGIPCEHAWVMDRNTGQVYDPTWDVEDGSEVAYFGIAFTREFIVKRSLITGSAAVFQDSHRDDFRIMRHGFHAGADGVVYDLKP